MPAFGACLLGSLNLAAFVEYNTFDWSGFKSAVRIAVRALNDVLDEGMYKHPLGEQQEMAKNWRQIGLGIMGLADMLIELEMRYGDPDSIAFCDSVASMLAREAISASINLAEDYDYYPCYRNLVEKSNFFLAHADSNIKDRASQYGMRNSQLLTIAPTGTISTMIGVSGGIEPIFANSYNRTTKTLHGEEKTYKVYTPIVQKYMELHGIKDEEKLPKWFATSADISVEGRIAMQSVWQSHIDASISSTVNLPKSATVEDVEEIYYRAWKSGLKGITVYRAGCAREGILVTDGVKKETTAKESTAQNTEKVYDTYMPVSRKTIGVTSGKTYCKKCACGTLYITVNRDSNGHVVETFVHTSKGGICQANLNGLNRMISVGLRSGVKVDEIADQLKGITCPACIKTMGKGTKLDGISCSDILGKTLLEFYNDVQEECVCKKTDEKPTEEIETAANSCPDCGADLIHEGGCVICLKCGWSKCS